VPHTTQQLVVVTDNGQPPCKTGPRIRTVASRAASVAHRVTPPPPYPSSHPACLIHASRVLIVGEGVRCARPPSLRP
jgi:hypothetical protein